MDPRRWKGDWGVDRLPIALFQVSISQTLLHSALNNEPNVQMHIPLVGSGMGFGAILRPRHIHV